VGRYAPPGVAAMTLHTLFLYIDNTLIYFYRIPEIPIIGYLTGTLFLALICVIAGQLTLTVAFKFNQKRIDQDNADMVKMHNLSVFALLAKNKNAYRACNKEANDAFGKVFFSQIALGISSLWPLPFALAWMQTRFLTIEFDLPVSLPVIGGSVGYPFTFILIYILTYILFCQIKTKLPYFKDFSKQLKSGTQDQLVSIADLYDNKHPANAGCT
jgi:hypothetical protein